MKKQINLVTHVLVARIFNKIGLMGLVRTYELYVSRTFVTRGILYTQIYSRRPRCYMRQTKIYFVTLIIVMCSSVRTQRAESEIEQKSRLSLCVALFSHFSGGSCHICWYILHLSVITGVMKFARDRDRTDVSSGNILRGA